MSNHHVCRGPGGLNVCGEGMLAARAPLEREMRRDIVMVVKRILYSRLGLSSAHILEIGRDGEETVHVDSFG